MIPYLKSLIRKPPVREHAWLNRRAEIDGVKNAQFASFLQQSGFRKRLLDRHQKTKKIKALVAFIIMWSVLLGFGWVAFESAQALELF